MPAQTPGSGIDPAQTLRLIWPQWQGAGVSSFEAFMPDFPIDQARRGYVLGATVLDAVLPPASGPRAVVPVAMGEEGLAERDGVEAKDVVARQLRAALEVIGQHDPARIVTLGGECSVSVAPFSALAARYQGDLAIIWIDSHPDISTPESDYSGWHSMALAALVGKGDPELVGTLPATVAPSAAAVVGLHDWFEDDISNLAEWGISSFAPDLLRASSSPVLEWLAGTGCSKVAIHFDVDAVDSEEVTLGLGVAPDGLRSTEIQQIMSDISQVADVVALTVAEYVPRQVMRMRSIAESLPLLGGQA